MSATNCVQREGGDFWFVTLKALNTTGSSSSPVVDHENGTYSVDLFVGWSGHVAVDIILVHPSIVTRFLDRITNNSETPRVYWKGAFIQPTQVRKGKEILNTTRKVTSPCYMMYNGSDSWKDKCSYTNSQALGNNTAWICDKPSGGVNCDKLVSYATDKRRIALTSKTILSESGIEWLFKR